MPCLCSTIYHLCNNPEAVRQIALVMQWSRMEGAHSCSSHLCIETLSWCWEVLGLLLLTIQKNDALMQDAFSALVQERFGELVHRSFGAEL